MEFNYYVAKGGVEISYHNTLEETLRAAQSLVPSIYPIEVFRAVSNILVTKVN